MEHIIRVYLTNREVKDIIKTFPNSTILRDYQTLLNQINDSISNRYTVEMYYEDDFIVTMQDILSRFNKLEYMKTFRVIDNMSTEFNYIYKPGGNKK